MKKLINILALMVLIIAICQYILFSIPAIKSERALLENYGNLNDRVTFIETQVQDLQDNYVSTEVLQPVLDDLAEYQSETDRMRNNLNDFNALWKQLFGYEQKQYVTRGK